MTQNNLYMEDDELSITVDVEPIFLYELIDSKNDAANSAQRAGTSETNAADSLSGIITYKSNLELLYAQALDGISDLYEELKRELISIKNAASDSIQTLYNTIYQNISSLGQQIISSITVTGQNIINQTKNYADEAKNTVDNRVSLDYLNHSKALETGDVSDNSVVLASIKRYAHSTYCGDQPSTASPLDPKKFIKVGSPVITDDGVVSGFSDNNYLQVNTIDFTKPFKIILPFRTSSTLNITQYLAISQNAGLQILINTSGQLMVRFGTTSWGTDIGDYTSSVLSPNTDYLLELEFTGSQYKITLNGVLAQPISSSSLIASVSLLILGRLSGNQYFTGSIDLKQFSITVDGVEVFSGNKTGIDTIKPDDYTVVGTPVISADGIASGFSGSNYLTSPVINNLGTSPFKIITKFKYILSDSQVAVYQIRNSGWANYLLITPAGEIKLYLSVGTSETAVYNYNGPKLVTGEEYTHIFEFTGSQYTFKVYQNETLVDSKSFSSSSSIYPSTADGVYIGKSNYGGTFTSGSIDLNAFKIYVDGNLIYQPCLKISYTESKTGSKIVNSIYRDRVNDMAEQFGYAPYYTLLENTKTDYTVVGSPTISSEYVASGFSASNRLSVNIGSYDRYSKIIFEGSFTTPNAFSKAEGIFGRSGGSFQLTCNSTGYLYFGYAGITTSSVQLDVNTKYDYIAYTDGVKIYLKYKKNSESTYNELVSSTNISGTGALTYEFNIGSNVSDVSTAYFTGSIDLNAFKIYVDNQLAYEAVTKPDFTLPKGEIYGMIEMLRKEINLLSQ